MDGFDVVYKPGTMTPSDYCSIHLFGVQCRDWRGWCWSQGCHDGGADWCCHTGIVIRRSDVN